MLLPPIRVSKPQERAPWFHLHRPGGPPLTLAEKLGACERMDQLEDLWAGAHDAHDWGVIVIQPEDNQAYLEAKKKLAPKRARR